MKKLFALFVLAAVALLGAAAQAAAKERFALVIGNSNYRSVEALPNPANDAEAMGRLLKAAGFQVTYATDLGQNEMRRAVRDFSDMLADKGEDTVALVYYAGHGVQIDGQNYLIPVDAVVERESDVALEAVRLADLLTILETAPSKTRIVILDACRNNPFEDIGTAPRGLAIVNAPAGSVIAYSTSPGTVAEDGSGRNSPFTKALVRAAREPGAPIESVFQKVRLAVHKTTGGRQTPWEVTALTEPFSFFPGTGKSVAAAGEKSETQWRRELRGLSPRRAYERVILQDNIIVYQIFVSIHARSPFAERIRLLLDRRLEMLAWFQAVSLNTEEAFAAFLEQYPKSDLAGSARRLAARAQARSLQLARTPDLLGLDSKRPQVRIVKVPGPVRTVVKEVVKEVKVPVPGPVRTVVKEVKVPVVKTVVKEVKVPVPGPVRTVVKTVKVPGPVRTVVKTVKVPVPGPVRTVVKTVRVPCKCGGGKVLRGPSPGHVPTPNFRGPGTFTPQLRLR
ncbi:MAG: hypothetical protein Kow0032_16810 [Methyloligellaceae bacterium]